MLNKTKISIYTIAKNIIRFDFPFIEAINSIESIADEIIINVGISEDGTENLIKEKFGLNPKVKIFVREWEGKDQKTAFLRNQSNWAKDQCKNDICLYLQADEIYHEDDLDKIRLVSHALELSQYYGAKFGWYHFDGDYATINPKSYQYEIRLIKKSKLESIQDAYTFGIIGNKSKLHLFAYKDIIMDASDIHVYHFGWVKSPEKMLAKTIDFGEYYHTKEEMIERVEKEKNRHIDGKYDYGNRDSHKKFEDTLPLVMKQRIKNYENLNSGIIKGKARFEDE